ncbi:MAG: L,D-transpeptidase family protein [Thermodesulfobacteriota bacterium]
MIGRFLCTLLAAAAFLAQPVGSAEAPRSLEETLAGLIRCFPLEQPALEKQEFILRQEELCLSRIYSATGMKPFWVKLTGPTRRADSILEVLEQAANEGLEPDDYNVQSIRQLWQDKSADSLAELDIQLTFNLVKYIHDITRGRLKPYEVSPELFAEAGDSGFDPLAAVEQVLAAEDTGVYLRQLAPTHNYYQGLRKALNHYQTLGRQHDWPTISAGKLIRPAERDERLTLIRQRLAYHQTLLPAESGPGFYDPSLQPVVESFQARFGLEIDGIIGPETLFAMNLTPADLARTISLNMTRWRWQSTDLGKRYIMVNIANYDLKAVEKGQIMLDMAVIVGQSSHQTPVFSDRIRYLDFNPFWNVPPSIAKNEELPQLRKNPSHLVERHIRLFSNWQADSVELDSTAIDWQQINRRLMGRYKLRQDPGPWNALGRVKFVFPNKYDVYLHDTSSHDLFEQTKRGFSHGCIRVSNPLALAEFALTGEDPDWNRERINEIIADPTRRVIRLHRPLPVHITYQTAWLDKQSRIHFNRDIYGRDEKLARILLGDESKEQ